MSEMKQKNQAGRQKKRLRRHKQSMLLVSLVLLFLIGVVGAGSISLREKNRAYAAQEAELREQLAEEEKRADEIENFEEYIDSGKYVEEVAKDKLGMAHKNEIIFKPES